MRLFGDHCSLLVRLLLLLFVCLQENVFKEQEYKSSGLGAMAGIRLRFLWEESERMMPFAPDSWMPW